MNKKEREQEVDFLREQLRSSPIIGPRKMLMRITDRLLVAISLLLIVLFFVLSVCLLSGKYS